MAFTYDDNPAGILRDAIRFLIGDTDADKASKTVSDGEIAFIAARYGFADIEAAYASTDHLSLLQVAEEACRALAGKYAKEASYSAGGMSETANQKASQTRTRANELRKMIKRAAAPVVFGRSQAEKDAAEADTDFVDFFFKRGQFENTTTDRG